MKPFLTLDQGAFRGRRVLVRVDFNVPLDANGKITDDLRIRESLPTIQRLAKAGGRLILCSHLGRPGGKREPSLSLKPVAAHLSKLLGKDVAFSDDCIGAKAEEAAKKLKDGEVLLVENLRYHKAEEENNPEFVESLAALGELYVNDAFGTAHRAHASTEGVARHLPSYAGELMRKELDALGGLFATPAKPFVAVLGGSKVSGKIDVIKNLLPRVDTILVGGAMAFTFSKAKGGRVGGSLVEEDKVGLAKQILQEARERNVEILLPVDVVATTNIKGHGENRVVPFGEVPPDWKGVDIGPKTVKLFGERIVRAKTVVFNGPMGVFEVKDFAAGTRGVFAAAADSQGTTIVGGGDSAAAIQQCGFADQVTHVSTGGGASLEFLEGKTLPGVAALQRHAQAIVKP
ncbi:MAG TPA: phosphoglycerate kinase [Candidatus Thermoplasmatota archaeon]|nr:phosphoglycerate kinase [Candidatus Thermoplasmatota archaeon]